VNTFTYSDAGLAITKQYEGLRLKAYQDSGGVWTIGYGHTGPEVVEGLVITEDQAKQLLLKDVDWAVDFVNLVVSRAINQNEFDALVDFTFNCGVDRFKKSSLLADVNANQMTNADAQFQLYVHDAHGNVEPGLVRRRHDEAILFMTPEVTQ
jgi:lysozyme